MISSPQERREGLESRTGAWRAMTISQALDAAVERYGDRPFVITDERTWTYAEMQRWSRELASGLIAAGIQAEDHVALILGNYPEFAAMKFAIARVGAAAVPINYLLRRRELGYILGQSDARILVTMDALRDIDYQVELDAVAPGWERAAGGEALPLLRHVFVHDGGGVRRPDASGLEDLAGLATPESDAELARREADGVAHFRSDVIYTSGTTGRPKGVMVTHDMVLRMAYGSAYWRAFEDGRRIAFALPMYHVFGYVECLIASMFVGGAIVPQVVFDPDRMLQQVERHRVSEIVGVPMMTAKLVESAQQGSVDLSSVVAVFSSGGMTPPGLWQDIRTHLNAREICTAYGMTETTASTTCTRPEDPMERLLTTNGCLKAAGLAGAGRPGNVLTEYRVVDPATGDEVAPGEMGEFQAKGISVTIGYYKKPEETDAAFTEDGWLRTGDLGTIDADGYLRLTGRLKESYRCGGEMVMPKEIEDLLNEHPLVESAYAVGVPDAKMGEIGCVFVVPAAAGAPDPSELIDLCARELARFKVPRHILFVDAADVPMTATGRPQKFLLTKMATERLEAAARPEPASA